MEKVQSYIDANKERFLNELFDLLRIPSISAQSEHKEDMIKCAEWLAASLVQAGADRAEVMPTEGNPVAYAEKIVDPAAKTVLVYGPYDVMPVSLCLRARRRLALPASISSARIIRRCSRLILSSCQTLQ